MAAAAGPALGQDVIGSGSATVVARYEDTLLDIARQFDLGYVEIRAANPGVDPWLPPPGTVIRLASRHILPAAPRRGIVINLPELRLYFYPPGGGQPLTFPLGIGGEGKETPVGSTKVVRKTPRPTWYPTASEKAEDPELPDVVPPGPDNPMGDFAMYLGWRGYAIHGSNKPYSIGRRDSHGCIRMYPEDVQVLYGLVAVGTPVTVVNQPAKVGWSGGQLYLEVHSEQDEADALESTGQLSPGEVNADDLVARAAGREAWRLNWYSVHLAETARDGLVVPVLRPDSVGE